MASAAWLLLPDLVAVCGCGVAAAIDLRHKRIPNWLTIPGFFAGLGINAALFGALMGPASGLEQGLVPALVGGGVTLVAFFALAMTGAIGMGDVKLVAAAGAFLRWPLASWLLVYVLLAGGALALAYALAAGKFRAVLRNLFAISAGDGREVSLHRIPYGLAIWVGCILTVSARHLSLWPVG